MKRLLLIAAVAVSAVCLTAGESQAQFGSSTSSSWSSNYSKSWSSSQGFGPGGYFNNTASQEQASGSFTTNRRTNTPWGGSNTGSSTQWGANRSNFNNSGITPFGGAYNSSGGSQNSFIRGQNWNNGWRW